jgi:hypothetical protein
VNKFTQELHGATSQKTALSIVTAVKNSNLTLKYTFRKQRYLKKEENAGKMYTQQYFNRIKTDVT